MKQDSKQQPASETAPGEHDGTKQPSGTQETGPREVIEQAARDIRRGLRDTDLHGIPTNVPGPGADPEHSPGAEVPVDPASEAKPGKPDKAGN